MSRSTLYTQSDGQPENECGVAVEIMWDAHELRVGLASGDITVEQVIATMKRGVDPVSEILRQHARLVKDREDREV
jgi:hypothetical protein